MGAMARGPYEHSIVAQWRAYVCDPFCAIRSRSLLPRGTYGVRAFLIAAILFAGHLDAHATSALGQTGRTTKSGGSGCASCHAPAPIQTLSVSISGAGTLAPGASSNYLVTATAPSTGANVRMGVDIAASDTPSPLSESASNLVLDAATGEIVHTTQSGTVPLNVTDTSGKASYSFTFTMPAAAAPGSTHTLYATARIGTAWGHAPNFIVTVPKAPALTSAPAATFYLGNPGSFAMTASGAPPPALSLSGTLPSGIGQTQGTGSLTLAGQPGGAELDYPLIITAANGIAPAATQNFTLSVRKSSQFITFTGPASQTFNATPIALAASAASSLLVAFSSITPGVCSVGASGVTMLALGDCTIAANQPGDANFNPAPQVLQTFTIQAIIQTVSFGAQLTRTFSLGGTFEVSPLAFASTGLTPITYTSSTLAVCTVIGTTVTMVAAGTCTLLAKQAGNSVTREAESLPSSFAINPPPSPGVPRLVTPRLPDATLNRPYSANIMMAAALPVSSASVSGLLPPGLTATHIGSGSIVISGTPTAGGNFMLAVSASNVIGPGTDFLSLLVTDTANYASNVARLSGGGSHSCVVVNGGVQCWGLNFNGQLGNGGTTHALMPVQALPPGSGATAISAGDRHTCAVVNGGVKCWGDNTNGKLGNSNITQSTIPVLAIAEGSGATAVAAGVSHTCAVVNEGVQCWGLNTYGQLGTGDTAQRLVPTQVIPAMSGFHPSITAGNAFTCVVRNGGVQCWGINNIGQLGNGSAAAQSVDPVQAIAPGSNVVSVDAGSAHVCVARNGGVQCWGYNYYGQLGVAGNANSNIPMQAIAELNGVTAVAAGSFHSCAVANGGLRCWGTNSYGELGIASNLPSNVPVEVFPPGSNVSVATGGANHTCALVGGSVQCWGYTASLGNVSLDSIVKVPVQAIAAGSGVVAVTASVGGPFRVGGKFSCVAANGGTKCWGDNTSGQLGSGSFASTYLPVQAITPASNAVNVAGGTFHTCAVVNGSAKCWGSASNYQIGSIGGNSSNSPVQVFGLTSGVTAIATGSEHSCAVVNGGAQCWGKNQNGQLGDASWPQNPLYPVQVTGLTSGVTGVAAGDRHSCALVNGSVKCWGNNSYNQLGDGTSIQSVSPVNATIFGSGVTAVSSGGDTTCVVKNSGLKCLGVLNADVADGSGVTVVSPGMNHVCAVISGGVQCLGSNSSGQLGDGSTTESATPVQAIAQGSGVTAVSAGADHTCAVVSGGSVCWGKSDSGQLGDPAFYPYGKKVFAAVQVALVPQVISFASLAIKQFSDPPFTVSAIGGASGNPVVFASQTPGVCNTSGANGTTVTLTREQGTCTIVANQAGNASFAAATAVPRSFVVTRVYNVTTFLAAGESCAGGPAAGFSTSGQAVKVSLCVSTTTDGLCAVYFDLKAADAGESGRFHVAAQTTGPNFPFPSGLLYPFPVNNPTLVAHLGGWSGSVPYSGSNQLVATIDLTPQATATNASYNISLDLATSVAYVDNDGYCNSFSYVPLNASMDLSLLVPQTITFNALANKLTIDAPFTVTATGGASGNPVTFSSLSPAICATSGIDGALIMLAGSVGTCTIAADQAGDGSYAVATRLTRSFTVTVPPTFSVTPSAGANGTISPASVQTIVQGGIANFTLSPDSGYSASVGGTCGGAMAGNMFTTNAIVANCTVVATFTPIPPTAPGAPVIGIASAGNAQVTVTFSPPSASGASAIDHYTATCLPGGASAINSVSPIIVTGLANNLAYTCSVTATNATTTGAASAASNPVTPVSPALWTTNCSGCHGPLPSGTKFNAGGTTGAVLSHVIETQATMKLIPSLGLLSAVDRAAIATYIAQQIPAIAVSTPANTAKAINVASHITLNTISFDSVQAVTAPVHGVLSTFSGTVITYTPNAGFTGTDTFTYRGALSSPAQFGDPRMATVTVGAPSGPVLVAVQSRKTHGAAGTFDLPIDFSVPVNGAVTVESRAIGAGHLLVFQFDAAVTSVSGATAQDASLNPVGVVSATSSGNDVLVTLTAVPDNARVTVTIPQLNALATPNITATLGFLAGDANNTGAVNSSDVSAVKARSGQTATALNFKFDVNASGAVNSSDISAVKARSGLTLPQ